MDIFAWYLVAIVANQARPFQTLCNLLVTFILLVREKLDLQNIMCRIQENIS